MTVGDGPTILVLHGYGMQPATYLPMARLLADRARVVIPAIFELPERWTFDHALDCLESTLDELAVDRVSLMGHSFGGGLELGLAARMPGRIRECVFSDTLGVHREFGLAWEAVHPIGILRMATRPAATSFVQSWATHPIQLSSAALWAFFSNRAAEIQAIADEGIPCHVMWAERDTVLSRADGAEFARRLRASFNVANRPPGYEPIDHDWMFDDPELFVAHLDELRLDALSVAARPGER
ncbi:MAG TPA: alpha/beta fold hydrolase [Acidimicrobiia bacterium]